MFALAGLFNSLSVNVNCYEGALAAVPIYSLIVGVCVCACHCIFDVVSTCMCKMVCKRLGLFF